ncbi:FecR family protein [Pedobacter sp. AW31-3R]|uniref:FecR family protein n=1 Tax=Pedobacter sp. AW31-3R TaxID=3445781 RepID=UPI003F9F2CC1
MKDELAIQAQILNHLNAPGDKVLAQQVADQRLESVEYEDIYQETLFIWDTAPLTHRLEGIDHAAAVRKFQERIIVKKKGFIWLKIAAAVFFAMLTIFFIYPKKAEEFYLVKETNAQIDSLRLSDGTTVVLGAHSRIKYAKVLNDTLRELFLLKGKAFFKVHRDVQRPFFVNIHQSRVSVLGTSFNIDYEEKSIRLAVVTGKVMFSPNSVSQPSILKAGEALNYDILNRKITMETAANANSWFTKELEFVDMPLDEVCRQLSSYYKVKIVFRDDLHANKKFNANFKDSTLEEVLSVLKQTYKMHIVREKESITINMR